MRYKLIWQNTTHLNVYDTDESVLVANGMSVYESGLWSLMRSWAYSVNPALNSAELQNNFIYTLMANATGKTPQIVNSVGQDVSNDAVLRTIISIQRGVAYVSEIEIAANSMTGISGSMLSEIAWENMKNMLGNGLPDEEQERAIFNFIESGLNVEVQDLRYREPVSDERNP